jgi:hypothetical protein
MRIIGLVGGALLIVAVLLLALGFDQAPPAAGAGGGISGKGAIGNFAPAPASSSLPAGPADGSYPYYDPELIDPEMIGCGSK